MEKLARAIAAQVFLEMVGEDPPITTDTPFEVTIRSDGQELQTRVQYLSNGRRVSTTYCSPLA
jgi:hypothetical protein